MPLLLVLSIACFTSALSMRILDPMVPQVARELAVLPDAVALLGTAFALPYAVGQPVLGPLGDAIGKARVIQFCLGMLGVMLVACSLAPTYETLFAARVAAGLFAGGIIPLAYATIGDRFDFTVRQVVLSRAVMASLLGQLASTVGAGLVGSALGWRVVLFAAGLAGVLTCAIAIVYLKPRPDAQRKPVSIAGMRSTYGAILGSSRALVCYAAVFAEGVVIFGLGPYIAVLLEQRGAGGVREAGLVIAGLGLGGVAYTLVVSRLLASLGGMLNVMRVGGVVTGIGIALLALGMSWPKEMAACVVLGFGFFMLHNGLQTQATELAPQNRGAAVSLFAFCFFLGNALGPILYGVGIARLGAGLTFSLAALAMAALGLLTAHGLARTAAPVR